MHATDRVEAPTSRLPPPPSPHHYFRSFLPSFASKHWPTRLFERALMIRKLKMWNYLISRVH